MPRPSGSSSGFDDDIVERRLGDPLSMAILVVCALCLVGASVLQVWECFQYRGPERDTLENAARDHRTMLVSRAQPLWTAFSQTSARALERVPVLGTLEGTTFVPEDPTAFQGLDVQELVARLCAEYGYGNVVYRPALQHRGVGGVVPGPDADEPPRIDEAAIGEIIGITPVEPAELPDSPELPDDWFDDPLSEPEEPADDAWPEEPADDAWPEPDEPADDAWPEEPAEEPADDDWGELEDIEF